MEKVKLGTLHMGSTFKRCTDGNTYIVTSQRNEHGCPLCTNLDTGSTYYWWPDESVIVVERLAREEEYDSPRPINRNKFYMCYVDGGDVPKHQHWSLSGARTEAERLSMKTEKDVFLLEAMHFVRVEPPMPSTVWKATC